MPKLSVVIPVYGVEEYIERCAISLFEQTLTDVEYIFVDDCTPDSSIDILNIVIDRYRDQLLKDKKRILIERMEKNSGQAAVRKRGIELCSGDYVIHCDSDDWVDKDTYRLLYEKAIEGDYDMVRCDFVRTDGIKESLCAQIPSGCYDEPIKLIVKAMSGFDLTSTCDKVFKRTLYHKGITMPLHNMQEDAALVVQLLYYCKKCAHVSHIGYYYYINPASISHTTSEDATLARFNQVRSNAELIYKFLEDKGVADDLCNAIVAHKLCVKNHILNLVDKWKYYKLWRSTYKEIGLHVLANKLLSVKMKMLYVSVYTGVFSLSLILWRTIKKMRA